MYILQKFAGLFLLMSNACFLFLAMACLIVKDTISLGAEDVQNQVKLPSFTINQAVVTKKGYSLKQYVKQQDGHFSKDLFLCTVGLICMHCRHTASCTCSCSIYHL